MKEAFIKTENYNTLNEAVSNLLALPPSAPRICLGYGSFGQGKTMSLDRIAAQHRTLIFRAGQTWTKSSFLGDLCDTLGLDRQGTSSTLYARAMNDLRGNPRLIIIDEIDTLLRSTRYEVLETVRDLHDEAYVPILFVGMEESDAKFKKHKHYYSRIVEFVKFKSTGLEDIKQFCSLSDIEVEDDLVKYFTTKYGNLRQIKVLILRLEGAAKVNDIKSCGLKQFKQLELEHGQ